MNFMAGRHGLDGLGRFTLIAAVVIYILNLFFRNSLFSLLYWALLIFTIFRMFSKNNSKRNEEDEAYEQTAAKVKNWFSTRRRITDNQKGQTNQAGQTGQTNTYQDPDVCIFECPKCGQKIRVPKGKGKIEITCPNCGEAFVEKS